MRFHKLGLSLIASVIAVAPITVVQADEQFIPALVYRTGPYAAGGTGFFGGMLDVLALFLEYQPHGLLHAIIFDLSFFLNGPCCCLLQYLLIL